MRTNQIVKASLFTLILALMAIGTMAIAEVMKKEKPVKEERAVATVTWYFNPSEPTQNPNLPSNYTLNPPAGVSCGGDSDILCSIRDIANPADPSRPNMSHGDVSQDGADQYEKSFRVE